MTSMKRLRQEKFARIAPTHFGIFDDPEWQLREVEKALDDAERWMEEVMPADPSDRGTAPALHRHGPGGQGKAGLERRGGELPINWQTRPA